MATAFPYFKERSLEKKKTLWARLNAVEALNQHDLDITNVVTTQYTDEAHTENGIVEMTNGKAGFVTDLKFKILESNSTLADTVDKWTIGVNELIASKGYVDNAIVVAINKYAETTDTGDEVYANVRINDVNIDDVGNEIHNTDGEATIITRVSCNIVDEKSSTNNPITFTEKKDHNNKDVSSLDSQDYYNAQTVEKLVTAINMLNAQNQSNVNNVYENVNRLMTALQYVYDDKSPIQTTTGSLLNFDTETPTSPSGEDTPSSSEEPNNEEPSSSSETEEPSSSNEENNTPVEDNPTGGEEVPSVEESQSTGNEEPSSGGTQESVEVEQNPSDTGTDTPTGPTDNGGAGSSDGN